MPRGAQWLPQAHSCYNTIDLPAYDSPALLRSKFLTALCGCNGFGLK